jgi:hypothetical protein
MDKDDQQLAKEVGVLAKEVEALDVPRRLTIVVLTIFAVVALAAWLLA